MTNEEIQALIQRLQGLEPKEEGGEIDDEAVASVLQGAAQPVYQLVFDKGHGAATARSTSKTEELEKKAREATERAERLETQIQELEEKQPDTAKLREEHRQQMQQLKDEHEQALKAEQQARREERKGRAKDDLQLALVTQHNVLPVYARALANDPETEKRLRWNEEGELEILQKGKDIPLAVSDGSPLEALAKELREKETPDEMVKADGDRGSGSQAGGSGGGGSFYSRHRKQMEERRKQEAETRSGGSAGLERLRGASGR